MLAHERRGTVDPTVEFGEVDVMAGLPQRAEFRVCILDDELRLKRLRVEEDVPTEGFARYLEYSCSGKVKGQAFTS